LRPSKLPRFRENIARSSCQVSYDGPLDIGCDYQTCMLINGVRPMVKHEHGWCPVQMHMQRRSQHCPFAQVASSRTCSCASHSPPCPETAKQIPARRCLSGESTYEAGSYCLGSQHAEHGHGSRVEDPRDEARLPYCAARDIPGRASQRANSVFTMGFSSPPPSSPVSSRPPRIWTISGITTCRSYM